MSSVAIDDLHFGDAARLLRAAYPAIVVQWGERTTNYGHFGRELPEFTWERTTPRA